MRHNKKNKKKNNNNNNNTQQQQQQQKLQQQQQESAKDKEIASLREELKRVNERMDVMESQIAVTARVNTMLAQEIDRLEQYGRRNSIVIRGIKPDDTEDNAKLKECVRQVVGEGLNMKSEFNRDFDKTHRIGPVLDTPHGKRQDVIVRFKSHATRYQVYHRRKELKDKNKDIRITPSLTKNRRKLLSQARKDFEPHPNVNFIYASDHGDVKVRFHNKVKNKFVT